MKENLEVIWNEICAVLRQKVSEDTFLRWFDAIELRKTDGDCLHLSVPNNIYQLWIESNYLGALQQSIAAVLPGEFRVQFVHETGPAASELPPQSVDQNAEGLKAQALQVPASDKKLSSRRARRSKEAKCEERAEDEALEAAVVKAGMNPRYRFDSFVVGTNNQFAHAASLAVAQSPARTYNPLFVYGGVGLGKTHLMQAIGQQVLAAKKKAKVLYISSEKFTNEFIDAIQNGTLVAFRKRYRQADLLLIDDIQFLAGKERSQEEFFHTFNTLFDGRKQIVLSSDRPPSEISNLEGRLVSRFEWGLTAELQPPDVETRTAILRKKTQELQVKLEDQVLDFLAEHIHTNVRRLEGGLMRVASYASLSGQHLDLEAVQRLLKDILQEEAKKTITIDHIQKKVAEHFDVRLADMSSKRRPAHIAFPRQVAMFLARELTDSSLAEIGEAFGGRDHGTVIHACRLVTKRAHAENRLQHTISLLQEQLQR